jgi:hypothetical protein
MPMPIVNRRRRNLLSWLTIATYDRFFFNLLYLMVAIYYYYVLYSMICHIEHWLKVIRYINMYDVYCGK